MNPCERAMKRIADMEGSPSPVEDASTLAHLVACRRCLSRLDQLARAAISTETLELSCAESRSRMPDLRAALAESEDPMSTARALSAAEVASPDEEGREASPLARLAALAAHLRRCPDCSAELRALDDVLARHEAGELEPAPAGMALDLGFLSNSARAGEPGRLWHELTEGAGRRARRLNEAIRLVLEEGSARFGDLADMLQPQPITASAFRGAREDEGARVGERLSVPDAASDLNIQLSIGPAANDRAVVALRLSRARGAQPLADTRVLLYDEGARLLAGEMTTSEGSATFQDLVVGEYLLEVRLGEGRWQLPFVVSEA